MTTEYKRMQVRGKTESEILAEDEVPLARELIVASDTGKVWPSDGISSISALPYLPPVDAATNQLPDEVRATLAENLTDPETPEGAAAAAIAGQPGPRGPEGPRGLPGTNGVATDDATASYIDASDTKTRAALGRATAELLAEPATAPAAPLDPYAGKEVLSDAYTVSVNGVAQWVHVARVQGAPFEASVTGIDAGGDYSFVNFEAPDTAATIIEVTSTTADLGRAELVTRRPDAISSVTRLPRRLRIVMNGPAKIVMMHDGVRTPLMLFGNAPEAPIDQNDPNVIYYGPGYYQPSGIIRVAAGKTLYLHRDAILKGTVSIDGDGATVRGRGIISGDHMPWGQGAPSTLPLLDVHGNNATIEGVTLRGGPTWSLPSWHVAGTNISNVKICNGRVQNDDGIGFINSTGGRVSDCFVRSDDDCLTVKGTTTAEASSDNQWSDMTLWSDRGRVLLIGHESKASQMDANKLTNSLVVHTHFEFYPLIVQPGDELVVSNTVISDIVFRGESQSKLMQLATAPTGTTSTTGGNVNGVVFSNIAVRGAGGVYATDVRGVDATHTVQNVAISNLTINGAKVTAIGPNVRVGANASSVAIS